MADRKKTEAVGKGSATVSPGIRTRNLGLRAVRVADIEDNPQNFRTHPVAQHDALAGTVSEIGWYGYPDCYETEQGQIRLIDGHLRKSLLVEKYGPDAVIEVNITDFDEAEARKAMLTHDPLAAMAEMDAAKLDELLREVDTGDAALSQMLAGLAEEAGMFDVGDGSAPELASGDKSPFQQMTFTLHDTQHNNVSLAIAKAKRECDFSGSMNENSNGNALNAIAEAYLGGS